MQLSQTHWSCQLRSVNAVLESYPALLECLSGMRIANSVGLHVKLCTFATVYKLMVFQTLLSVTEHLYKYLQSEKVDLAKAVEYTGAVCETLQQMRTDGDAAKLYETAKPSVQQMRFQSVPPDKRKSRND